MASKPGKEGDKDAVVIDFEPLKEYTKNCFLQVLSNVLFPLTG